MYQAIEAERKRPGSLLRWARWLKCPLKPEIKSREVLMVLVVCGHVWTDLDFELEEVRAGYQTTLDEFMDS